MKTMETLREETLEKGWKWWCNGMVGGQMQINIYAGDSVFSWWPLSKQQTLWYKRNKGKEGPKQMKHLTADTILQFIEDRLRNL